MATHNTAGTRFYIGPVVDKDTLKVLSNAAGVANFEAVAEEDWTEVEEIESFGRLGDTSQTNSFTAVKDARVDKKKTTRDAGTLALVCGNDRLDDGQIALAAAEGTPFNYRFKVAYNDARDDDYSPSTDYFAGMVLSKEVNLGDVQARTKREFNIAINTQIFEDVTDPTGS